MSEFDFQPYLEFVRQHYGMAQGLYTPTDAILLLQVRSVVKADRDREERGVEQQVEQFPVLAGLRKYAIGEKREHVLLAGRPGSGKSMALRQLVVELVAPQPPIMGEHELDNAQSPQHWGFGGQIPVLVQLKGDRAVPELIKAEFRRAKIKVTDEQIEDWLLADRLVLLLDGVNEIPNDDLRRSLAQFREDNLSVPMIFTTRDLSLGGDLGIAKRFEMQPLSEPQMRDFVGKYLPEQGAQLLGQLRDRLREIAETPLLLKMLCDVFQQTGEVPQNKGELFRGFDREYEKFKGLPAVSADFRRFKSEMLQYLAFVMMQGDSRTEFWLTIDRGRAERLIESWLMDRVSDPAGKAKEWLEDLLEHHLLQVAAEAGKIEFHHQLFQEYYAAEWLLGMFRDRHPDVVKPERFQHFYLNYLKWTETAALMLGLVEDEALAVRVVEQALDVDLMLGARLAGEIYPDFFGKTIEILSNLNLPKKLYIQCLGTTGSNQTLAILEKLFNEKDLFCQVVEALRVIGTEKAVLVLVDFIFRNLTCSESTYIYIIEALGEISNRNIIDHLQLMVVEHPLSHVREFATKEIGRIQQRSHRTKINLDSPPQDRTKTLSDPNNARAVLNRALLRRNVDISMKKPDELIDFIDLLIDCPSIELRIQSVKALAEMKHYRVLPLLDKALKNSHFDVRAHAARRIARVADPLVVPSLIRAFEQEQISLDHSIYVCSAIVRALGQTGDSKALPFIEGLIERDDLVPFAIVIEAVEQIGIPRSIEFLHHQLLSNKGLDQPGIIIESIAVIQANCKFYNYKIHQKALARQAPANQQAAPASPTYQFPNATEVKIIEHIDNYHESPPRDPPP